MIGTYEVASVICGRHSRFRCDVIKLEDGYKNHIVTKNDEASNTDFRAKSKKTLESVTYVLKMYSVKNKSILISQLQDSYHQSINTNSSNVR